MVPNLLKPEPKPPQNGYQCISCFTTLSPGVHKPEAGLFRFQSTNCLDTLTDTLTDIVKYKRSDRNEKYNLCAWKL